VDGLMVGHLLLSPCPVVDEEGRTVATVLAIGPVAVVPEVQRRGVGSVLMHAATSLAVARGVPALVLLGHPAYYPRFGFQSARALGLEPPTPLWPDPSWMARLLPAWSDEMRGTVRFPEAFEPLACRRAHVAVRPPQPVDSRTTQRQYPRSARAEGSGLRCAHAFRRFARTPS
jgi:putative acetyltransferase